MRSDSEARSGHPAPPVRRRDSVEAEAIAMSGLFRVMWNVPSAPEEATVGFSTQAMPSPVKNGVGPGESVAIEFTLQGGQTLQDVIDQLTTGQLRIGLHVIAFDSEGSESFVNRPVPEPTTAALVGGGLLALALRGRKGRRSRA